MEMLKLALLAVLIIASFNLATFITTGDYESLISAMESLSLSSANIALILLHKRLREKIGSWFYFRRVFVTIINLIAAYVQLKTN